MVAQFLNTTLLFKICVDAQFLNTPLLLKSCVPAPFLNTTLLFKLCGAEQFLNTALMFKICVAAHFLNTPRKTKLYSGKSSFAVQQVRGHTGFDHAEKTTQKKCSAVLNVSGRTVLERGEKN